MPAHLTATMARSGSTAAPSLALAPGITRVGVMAMAGTTTMAVGGTTMAVGGMTMAAGITAVAVGEEVMATSVEDSTVVVVGTTGMAVVFTVVGTTGTAVAFTVAADIAEFHGYMTISEFSLLVGGLFASNSLLESGPEAPEHASPQVAISTACW